MQDCIEHAGYCNKGGYGCVTYKQKSYLAHRLAWIKVHGEIPEGLLLRHRCDNRKCINVDHLELGTHKDNAQDAISRNRWPSGSKNSAAKMTDAQVAHCRAVYVPRCKVYGGAALARQFGVDQSTMSNILAGKIYK